MKRLTKTLLVITANLKLILQSFLKKGEHFISNITFCLVIYIGIFNEQLIYSSLSLSCVLQTSLK
jgi:hypothetical protein